MSKLASAKARPSPAASGGPVMIEHLPFDTDAGLAERAAIGVIVLGSDYTLEHEFRRLLAVPGVAYYQSRIRNDPDITPDSLRAMEGRITEAADVILPGTPLDVVAYGCTSASMVLGEEKVFERIRAARPQAKCTTPITAAFAAFKALGARRVGVLTPYRADVNAIVAAYIAARGIEVPVFGSFNEQNDAVVSRISQASLAAAVARLLDMAELDAIFVSCTSVRLAEAVVGLEEQFAIPLTSSNHAMAWHCLRLAGIDDIRPEHGRLFTRPLPA